MAGEAWANWPFPEVIDFQEGPGILAKDFREEGVPLVRLAGLDVGKSILNGCNYLDPEMVKKKWSHFALKEGDILLSTSASLGRVAVVDSDGVDAVAYTGLIRMRPRDQRVFAPFIRYLLASPDFQHQIEAAGVGSVIKHFGPMHLKGMSVNLPSPEEQRAIAHILGTLDDKIELNRRMNETLEAIARAMFKSWFVDYDPVRAKMNGEPSESICQRLGLTPDLLALFPDRLVDSELGEIPEGWKVECIYKIASVIYGAPFASSKFNSDGIGVPLIRIRDLKDEAPGVHTEEVHPKGYMVRAGDIVVGMDGEFRAYLWGGEDAWLNQRVCVFKPGDGYSASFIQNSIAPCLAHVEETETATTVIHLGKNDIDRFKIIDPAQDVLAAFNAATIPLYDQIVRNKKELRVIAAIRDALLPKLLSGELRVSTVEEATA